MMGPAVFEAWALVRSPTFLEAEPAASLRVSASGVGFTHGRLRLSGKLKLGSFGHWWSDQLTVIMETTLTKKAWPHFRAGCTWPQPNRAVDFEKVRTPDSEKPQRVRALGAHSMIGEPPLVTGPAGVMIAGGGRADGVAPP